MKNQNDKPPYEENIKFLDSMVSRYNAMSQDIGPDLTRFRLILHSMIKDDDNDDDISLHYISEFSIASNIVAIQRLASSVEFSFSRLGDILRKDLNRLQASNRPELHPDPEIEIKFQTEWE